MALGWIHFFNRALTAMSGICLHIPLIEKAVGVFERALLPGRTMSCTLCNFKSGHGCLECTSAAKFTQMTCSLLAVWLTSEACPMRCSYSTHVT